MLPCSRNERSTSERASTANSRWTKGETKPTRWQTCFYCPSLSVLRMAAIELTVNGERRTADVDPATPLLWVLRDEFGLTGTKFGCGIAQCGACTVRLDRDAGRAAREGAAMKLAVAVAAGAVLLAATSNTGANREDEGWRAFTEVATVLTHPRCLNCHVPGDSPLQGDEGRPHDMNVRRAADGRGTPAARCTNCHQAANSP